VGRLSDQRKPLRNVAGCRKPGHRHKTAAAFDPHQAEERLRLPLDF
jgi:hypothetical protein